MESEEITVPFRTKMIPCLKTTNLEQVKTDCHEKLAESLDSFESRGSGWIYVSWNKLTIKIAKWTPTSGSSYIPTPINLRGKRCLLNIRYFILNILNFHHLTPLNICRMMVSVF